MSASSCAVRATDPDNHWLTYTWRDDSRARSSARFRRVAGRSGPRHVPHLHAHRRRRARRRVERLDHRLRPRRGRAVHRLRAARRFRSRSFAAMPYTVDLERLRSGSHVLTPLSLSYSVDDGRTFQPVPGCSSLPPRTGQCVWQNPGPLGDVVRLRMIATGGGRDWIAVSNRIAITDMPAGFVQQLTSARSEPRGPRRSPAARGRSKARAPTSGERRTSSASSRGPCTATSRRSSRRGEHREPRSLGQGRIDGPREPGRRGAARVDPGHAAHRARHRVPAAPADQRASACTPPGRRWRRPGWLAIGRIGDTISAYYRASAERAVDAGRPRHAAGLAGEGLSSDWR